jgi:hypothetical protein
MSGRSCVSSFVRVTTSYIQSITKVTPARQISTFVESCFERMSALGSARDAIGMIESKKP